MRLGTMKLLSCSARKSCSDLPALVGFAAVAADFDLLVMPHLGCPAGLPGFESLGDDAAAGVRVDQRGDPHGLDRALAAVHRGERLFGPAADGVERLVDLVGPAVHVGFEQSVGPEDQAGEVAAELAQRVGHRLPAAVPVHEHERGERLAGGRDDHVERAPALGDALAVQLRALVLSAAAGLGVHRHAGVGRDDSVAEGDGRHGVPSRSPYGSADRRGSSCGQSRYSTAVAAWYTYGAGAVTQTETRARTSSSIDSGNATKVAPAPTGSAIARTIHFFGSGSQCVRSRTNFSHCVTASENTRPITMARAGRLFRSAVRYAVMSVSHCMGSAPSPARRRAGEGRGRSTSRPQRVRERWPRVPPVLTPSAAPRGHAGAPRAHRGGLPRGSSGQASRAGELAGALVALCGSAASSSSSSAGRVTPFSHCVVGHRYPSTRATSNAAMLTRLPWLPPSTSSAPAGVRPTTNPT